MALRVRHGSAEFLLPGEEALIRLYRARRIAPWDLVWHPRSNHWVRVDSFLFIDRRGPAARSDRSRLSEAESSGSPTQRPQESDEA